MATPNNTVPHRGRVFQNWKTPTFFHFLSFQIKNESRRSSGDTREKCGSTGCSILQQNVQKMWTQSKLLNYSWHQSTNRIPKCLMKIPTVIKVSESDELRMHHFISNEKDML